MAGKVNVQVLLGAQDKASGVLGSFTSKVKGFASDLTKAAGISSIGFGAMGAAAFKMASDSASAAERSRFFWETFGDDVDDTLGVLRAASKGTISDINLMGSSNRAALLGVSTSIDELSGLMVTARLRGKAMGLTTTQAFDDLVTGIGRGSPLILDNLGIKIPDSFKKMSEKMTSAEKTTALMNLAIKDGAALSKELGGDVLTTGDRFAQLRTKAANFRQELGEKLIPIVLKVMDKIGEISNILLTGGKGLLHFAQTGDFANDFMTKFANKLGISNESFTKFARFAEKARAKLIDLWKKAEPYLLKLEKFFKDNMQATILAVGAVILTFFTAWAISAAAAAIATIAATAPILIVIAAIAAAVFLLKTAWDRDWGGIQEKVTAVSDYFTNSILPAIKSFVRIISNTIASVVEFMRPKWEDVKEIVGLAMDVIKQRIELAWAIIGPIVKKGVEFVQNVIIPGFKQVAGFIKDNSDNIMQVVKGLWNIIVGIINTAWALVAGIIKTGLNLLKGDWKGAWESIKEAFSGVWDGIGQVVNGVWETIKGAFKIGFNALIEIINSGIRNVNGNLDKLRGIDIIGGAIPDVSIPEIPKLAKGGSFITKGPQLFVAGDNPSGEERVTVEPLDGRGMAGGFTIVINGDVFGVEDLAEKTIKAIKDKAKANAMNPSDFLNLK